MASIRFNFSELVSILKLNIGITNRLDENRAESFTVLFLDLNEMDLEVINQSLEQFLRDCDSIISYENYYFFILPYTDKYGSLVVKNMFEEFFDKPLPALEVAFPVDGESASELLASIQLMAKTTLSLELHFLDNLL